MSAQKETEGKGSLSKPISQSTFQDVSRKRPQGDKNPGAGSRLLRSPCAGPWHFALNKNG